MKNKYCVIPFSLIFVIFFSCVEVYEMPYVITEPEYTLGEVSGAYLKSGIHFLLYNNTDKNIESFTFTCIVFDENGNNPFIGSNTILAKYEEEIDANNFKEIIISLDPYIYVIPNNCLLFEQCYVSKIVYTDGSVWKDRNGYFLFGG